MCVCVCVCVCVLTSEKVKTQKESYNNSRYHLTLLITPD